MSVQKNMAPSIWDCVGGVDGVSLQGREVDLDISLAREARNEVGISSPMCVTGVYVGFYVDQNQYGLKCQNQFWFFHVSVICWVPSILVYSGRCEVSMYCLLIVLLHSVVADWMLSYSFCTHFYTAMPNIHHKILCFVILIKALKYSLGTWQRE